MRKCIQIILILVLISCNQQNEISKSEDIIESNNLAESVLDTSLIPVLEYSNRDLNFVFSKQIDPLELGLYQKLEIFNSGASQLILDFDYLELEGQEFALDSNHVFVQNDNFILYLIAANNRPEPDFFYIVKQENKKLKLLGKTEPLDFKFHKDIDGDGVLELGGFNTNCQAIDLEEFDDPEFCLDHFRVYEISSEIIRDTITEEREINNIRQLRI